MGAKFVPAFVEIGQTRVAVGVKGCLILHIYQSV